MNPRGNPSRQRVIGKNIIEDQLGAGDGDQAEQRGYRNHGEDDDDDAVVAVEKLDEVFEELEEGARADVLLSVGAVAVIRGGDFSGFVLAALARLLAVLGKTLAAGFE